MEAVWREPGCGRCAAHAQFIAAPAWPASLCYYCALAIIAHVVDVGTDGIVFTQAVHSNNVHLASIVGHTSTAEVDRSKHFGRYFAARRAKDRFWGLDPAPAGDFSRPAQHRIADLHPRQKSCCTVIWRRRGTTRAPTRASQATGTNNRERNACASTLLQQM